MFFTRFEQQILVYVVSSMAEFPRWRGLEHFSAATAIDFTEGNTFLALLKVRVFFPSFF